MKLKIWALFALALFGWFAMPTQTQAFFFRCGPCFGGPVGCGVRVPVGGSVCGPVGVPVPVQNGAGYGKTTTVYPNSGGCLNGLCPVPVGGGVNPPRIPPVNIPEPKETAPKPKELPKKNPPKSEEEIKLEDFYLSATPKGQTTTLNKGDSLSLEKGVYGVRMLLEWEGGVWPGDGKHYPKGSFKYIKEVVPDVAPQPLYQTQGFTYPSTGVNPAWVRYPNQGNFPTILSPQLYRVGGCPNGNCPR